MRYMLLQYYGEVGLENCPPIHEWAPDDVEAHIRFQQTFDDELTASGELVDSQGLAEPEQARFVVADGATAPVVTDGPFPEFKELLAGYRTVDVDSVERVIEIAAKASAAPGPAGAALRQPIEVREILSAPPDLDA